MNGMHRLIARIVFVAAGALAATTSAAALDWNTLLEDRLAQNVDYREALLNLQVARQRVGAYDDLFAPYLGLSVAPEGGALISQDGIAALAVSPTLALTHLFGGELSLSAPVSFDASSLSASFDGATLSYSRSLFDESDSDLLSLRAALVRAQEAVRTSASSVRLDLVEQIFSAWTATRSLEYARRAVDVSRAELDASRDDPQRRTLERALLSSERAARVAQQTLDRLDDDIVDSAQTLYDEIGPLVETWLAALPAEGSEAADSGELAALRLDLAAAQLQEKRGFLAWTPNPQLSLGVGLDSDGSFTWSLSASIDVSILDRGERSIAALQRSEGAEIARLSLDEQSDTLAAAVNTAWSNVDLAGLDVRIDRIDLQTTQESTERTRALHADGYATDADLERAELALLNAQLTSDEAQNAYRLACLKLLDYYDDARMESDE